MKVVSRVTSVSGTGEEQRRPQRLCRLVPPAITPLRVGDIAAGIKGTVQPTAERNFERRIEQFLDGEHAASYPSFRQALAACLREVTASSDCSGAVALPAFCSQDYPKVLESLGVEICRYDIDRETLAADPEAISALDLDSIQALIVINVLGYGSPMEAIQTLCDQHDIFLIEALGYGLQATYRGDALGTFGDCSVLNFQQGKPIPVGGGMVVSTNPKLEFSNDRPTVAPNVATLAGYSLFGRPRAYYWYHIVIQHILERVNGDERVSTHPAGKEGASYTEPSERLSRFQRIIASRVLDRLDHHRESRADTAAYYRRRLAELDAIQMIRPIEGLENHQHVRYPLVVSDPTIRADIQSALAEIGVQANVLYDWPPLEKSEFPDGAYIQERILTLPTHPYVDETDRESIVREIRSVVS